MCVIAFSIIVPISSDWQISRNVFNSKGYGAKNLWITLKFNDEHFSMESILDFVHENLKIWISCRQTETNTLLRLNIRLSVIFITIKAKFLQD